MRYAAPFLVVLVIVAACVTAGLLNNWRLERAKAAGYAAALAECANGRSFTIGKRIVFCMVTDAQ